MKKVVFAALVAALATGFVGSTVWAGSIYGPASPLSSPGKFTLGAAYNWYGDRWEGNHGMPDIKIGQNQAVVEGAYGISRNLEVYGRLGGGDVKAKLEGTEYTVNDDMNMMGTAGARMVFARINPQVSIGGNLQLNYAFSDYNDNFYHNTVKIRVKDFWDANFALYGQYQPARNVMVYAGPQVYYGEFKTRVNDYGDVHSATYEPKSHVGGVLGTTFAIPNVQNVKFFAETQYRDKFSLGAGVAYNF